jgi:acetylornithine/succinyldiaminopimelate/putrescine aminotransferase
MGAGTHGTTFGGNPVACAASLATLRILEEEGLLAKAAVQIDVVRAQAARRPLAEVTEIRGRGAMIGIQVGPATEERAAPLAEAMSQRGVLVTICGGHTVRLLLPYGAGAPELSQVWDVLAESIAATA